MVELTESVADVRSYPCHVCGGQRMLGHGPDCDCQCEFLISKEPPEDRADPTA